jgi:hypothetical protein
MQDATDAVAAKAVEIAKATLKRAIATDGLIPFAAETQVHRAVDLLRSANADAGLLRAFESTSCAMAEMRHLHRQGRVNHYASRLLRLRRAVDAM